MESNSLVRAVRGVGQTWSPDGSLVALLRAFRGTCTVLGLLGLASIGGAAAGVAWVGVVVFLTGGVVLVLDPQRRSSSAS